MAKKPAKKSSSKPKSKSKPKHVAKQRPSKPTSVVRLRSQMTPASAPAPRTQEPPLKEEQIQKYRDILVQKRDELLDVVQRKKEQEIQVGEPEVGDEADVATRSVEKEMLFQLTDSEKQTLDMVEATHSENRKRCFWYL